MQSTSRETSRTPRQHQNFIDWMKAVGMFLIVFGHVVGSPFNQFTQPIYPKQLGVAFFVFITAWSLANESRSGLRVLFNRLFPVYFLGVFCALFLSILFLLTKNDTNPSNYLPFFFGVNVFFNNFPANPTTWYIGTYLHLLLFWFFFLQKKTIRKRHLFLALICEIIIRSFFMASGKPFIAYMLLPNWATVFLLGLFLVKKQDNNDSQKLIFFLPIWLGVFVLWAFIGNAISFDTSFPFRHMVNELSFSTVIESVFISLIYCTHTLIFFAIARRLPRLRFVSFFARNTLVIFIVHMPIIYGLSPVIYSLIESTFLKKITLIIILYVGLAILSETINRNINIIGFREKLWKIIR